MLKQKKYINKELPQKVYQVYLTLLNELNSKKEDFKNQKNIYIAITLKYAYDYQMVRLIQKLYSSKKWACILEKYKKSIENKDTYIYIWVFKPLQLK